MPQKNKKPNESSEPMEILPFITKLVQDSAITIFWESVDRFKREVKVKIELGLKSILSALIVAIGLIFTLVGVARFLEEMLGIGGFGYIFTGIAVVVAGIYLGERARKDVQK